MLRFFCHGISQCLHSKTGQSSKQVYCSLTPFGMGSTTAPGLLLSMPQVKGRFGILNIFLRSVLVRNGEDGCSILACSQRHLWRRKNKIWNVMAMRKQIRVTRTTTRVSLSQYLKFNVSIVKLCLAYYNLNMILWYFEIGCL